MTTLVDFLVEPALRKNNFMLLSAGNAEFLNLKICTLRNELCVRIDRERI